MIIAALSTSAFPLLAGFPGRLVLWENLAHDSLTAALWMGIGVVGLLTSVIRSLAVLSMAEEYSSWQPRETLAQRIMLGVGVMGIFILGMFPQAVQYFFEGSATHVRAPGALKHETGKRYNPLQAPYRRTPWNLNNSSNASNSSMRNTARREQ